MSTRKRNTHKVKLTFESLDERVVPVTFSARLPFSLGANGSFVRQGRGEEVAAQRRRLPTFRVSRPPAFPAPTGQGVIVANRVGTSATLLPTGPRFGPGNFTRFDGDRGLQALPVSPGILPVTGGAILTPGGFTRFEGDRGLQGAIRP